MIVTVTGEAEADLENIGEYIGSDNPAWVVTVVEELIEAAGVRAILFSGQTGAQPAQKKPPGEPAALKSREETPRNWATKGSLSLEPI